MSRSKKVALFNISKCFPNNSDDKNLEIYKNSLLVLADNIYTFCLLPKIDINFIEKNIDLEDFKLICEQAINDSATKSILFVTAHFGSFELTAHSSAFVNIHLSILSRQLNLPKTEKWWNSVREIKGNEVFTRKGGYKTTISKLRQGKNVAMLCDQNVKANNATFVSLFGYPAASTVTVGHAAATTGASVVFAVLAKLKNGKYKLLTKRIKSNIDPKNLEEFTKDIMENYHRALEDAVTQFPDHWFWFHRRFKTRPPGEKENFYESVDNS